MHAPQQLRLTEGARRALELAEEEARAAGGEAIGTEHLLLALLRVDDDHVSRALRELGFEYGAVRARGGTEASGRAEDDLRFDDAMRRVLELALREAVMAAAPEITPQHLLVSLAAETEGGAAAVFRDRGADAVKVRDALIRT